MDSAMESGIDRAQVLDWIRARELDGNSLINRGHQAAVYLYSREGAPLVLKTAYGKGFAGWLRRRMLQKEERIYRRLQHIDGLARCHGILGGKYLLLDYIDSLSYREASLGDRELFFSRLQEMIDAIHASGVAHGDLKTRSNIMVTEDGRPHIVDFGIAIMRKPGFAPINHWLFNMFVQFDRNAWVKLKYKKRLDDIHPEDEKYYRITWIERLARPVRNAVRHLRQKSGRH